MPEPRRDYLDRSGAEALSVMIERYWRSCGAEIGVWIEFVGVPGVWIVKSDLRAGLPPAAEAIEALPAAAGRRRRENPGRRPQA
jgi:hypothetical protein